MSKARTAASVGYSDTPLVQKLGIKEGTRVFVASAPAEYRTLVQPIPRGVTFQTRVNSSTNLAHIFVTREFDGSLCVRRVGDGSASGSLDLAPCLPLGFPRATKPLVK